MVDSWKPLISFLSFTKADTLWDSYRFRLSKVIYENLLLKALGCPKGLERREKGLQNL
jgi:hypothetical protein